MKEDLRCAINNAWEAVQKAEKLRERVFDIIDHMSYIPDFKEAQLRTMVTDYLTPLSVGGITLSGDVTMNDILSACDEKYAFLLNRYRREYERLHTADVENKVIPDRNEAFDAAMSFTEAYPQIVADFESYQEDIISSDREIEALGFALLDDEVYEEVTANA